MAELVASGLKREAQVLEIASKLAMVPEIAGGSITSYAGGAARAGLGPRRHRRARARAHAERAPDLRRPGSQDDRQDARAASGARDAQRLRDHRRLAEGRRCGRPVFDIDSVQLAAHIAELRARTGTPFHISCAVSPFKYQREDCLYQYLKLEKKIAAGADMAITQVGWDATKFVELKRYLDERGIKTPVLGNVYVLSRRAAERMATGNPPGCWASASSSPCCSKESEAPDGGLQARLERAAQDGGGPQGHRLRRRLHRRHTRREAHRADHPPRARSWRRSGRSCCEELQFGKKDGFYLYKRDPQPKPTRTFLPTVLDAAGKALPCAVVEEPQGLAGAARASRALSAGSTPSDAEPLRSSASSTTRRRRSSAARTAATACSVTWSTSARRPARSRCATARAAARSMAQCEVIDQECIWVKVMARAEASNTIDQLKSYIPPPDRRLTGTASWLNFYLGRDSRPGRPKELWETGAGPGRTVAIDEDEQLKTAGPSAADKALAARTPPKPSGKKPVKRGKSQR